MLQADMLSSTSCLLQKLCAEAPSVSLEELGEDEAEARAAKERG